MKKIKSYINQASKKGFTSEQIKKKLLNGGYPLREVDKLISKYYSRPKVFRNLLIIIVIFIILFVGVYYYFFKFDYTSQAYDNVYENPINSQGDLLVPKGCELIGESLLSCLKQEYGISSENYSFCGAYIKEKYFSEMNSDSIIIVGDIITQVDNKKVSQINDFYVIMLKKGIGEKITIVTESGKESSLTIYSIPEHPEIYDPDKKRATIGYSLATVLCKK